VAQLVPPATASISLNRVASLRFGLTERDPNLTTAAPRVRGAADDYFHARRSLRVRGGMRVCPRPEMGAVRAALIGANHGVLGGLLSAPSTPGSPCCPGALVAAEVAEAAASVDVG
jgi:hypothetical protein